MSKINKEKLKYLINFSIRKSICKSPTNKNFISNYNHFSFILVGNELLSFGRNNRKDNPIHWGYNNEFQRLHSEMSAYIKGMNRIGNRDFYVVNIRLSNSLHLLNSKPCIHCQALLKGLGCKYIIYSDNDKFEEINL